MPFNKYEKGVFCNTVNKTLVAEETVIALHLKPIRSLEEAEKIAQNYYEIKFDPEVDIKVNISDVWC